jgi:hypothetical protein
MSTGTQFVCLAAIFALTQTLQAVSVKEQHLSVTGGAALGAAQGVSVPSNPVETAQELINAMSITAASNVKPVAPGVKSVAPQVKSVTPAVKPVAPGVTVVRPLLSSLTIAPRTGVSEPSATLVTGNGFVPQPAESGYTPDPVRKPSASKSGSSGSKSGQPETVPDGGSTFGLLGVAFLGIALIKKKLVV